MQTIKQLRWKRYTKTIAIWLSLVLLGWLIFPPLPVFRIPDESAAAWSADGNWIATTSGKRVDGFIALHERYGPLDLWDLRDTASPKRLVPSEQRVRGVQFSKAGDLLLALCEDELCVWDTRTGKQIVKQKSGELSSQMEALVKADSEPPMVVMLRQTKPPELGRDYSYEGEVDFLALPSGETRATIGPVKIEPDSMLWWGTKEKVSLRISGDHKIAVTLRPAADNKAATQFQQWEISSGKLLATLVVSMPPIRWAISHDGSELIQLTKLVSPDASSATDRSPLQMEYWEFESSRVRKILVGGEKSLEQLVFESCLELRPASDSSLLLVSTMAGWCLVDTSGDRLAILANDIGSLISADGSLIAAKQGKVFNALFTGGVNTRSIELKRMPTGEVLRIIEARPGWDENEAAFDPLAFSQDQQKLIYSDFTDSGPLAVIMAHWGDLWNGSLLKSAPFGRRRTHSIRSMDISTGDKKVISRSARSSMGAFALGNQYVLVGDRVWRLSGGSPWLYILGLPTGVVVLVLTWQHLRQRRKIRMRKIDPEATT